MYPLGKASQPGSWEAGVAYQLDVGTQYDFDRLMLDFNVKY